MEILVKNRSYFESIKGTPEEEKLLATHRVISIQTSNGYDTEPPFSQHFSPRKTCCAWYSTIL
ncbi:MAG: hypothetical protein IJS08_10075 [Victivallales bacterium]|nr:hypothetical protein [Victivallales bacterium]